MHSALTGTLRENIMKYIYRVELQCKSENVLNEILIDLDVPNL